MSDNRMSADDLLRAALARVEAEAAKGNESLWCQEDWARKTSCGTAHCLGGWAAVIDGHELSEGTTIVRAQDGRGYRVNDWLLARFGDRADALWLASNHLGQLRAGVAAYLAGADAYTINCDVWYAR